MRLIDADALEKQLHELALDKWNQGVVTSWSNAYLECEDIVYDAPTVDPIKHGHWIERDFGLICSECNHYTETMYDEPFNNEFGKGWALKRPYYCGYCGAKMDEVSE